MVRKDVWEKTHFLKWEPSHSAAHRQKIIQTGNPLNSKITQQSSEALEA